MKIEDNGVTFDFSGVAVRKVKVDDEVVAWEVPNDDDKNVTLDIE